MVHMDTIMYKIAHTNTTPHCTLNTCSLYSTYIIMFIQHTNKVHTLQHAKGSHQLHYIQREITHKQLHYN